MTGYLVVAGVAFLAATVLPFYSEAVVLGQLYAGADPFALWVAATTGNTLGAVLNWGLGRGLERWRRHRWFPVSEAALARAQGWFARYGVWSLLLAWLPVGGDALTFIGGLMRVPLTTFTLLTGIGKGARYGVLIVPVASLM